jgi:hypothetical protein
LDVLISAIARLPGASLIRGTATPHAGQLDQPGWQSLIVRASQIYAEDAVVEWPQGGERLRGKANIIGFRSTYPASQQFQLHRTTGCHNLWVNEYTIRYDDQPVMAVGIMEFRDGEVIRERIYFGEPWEPPAWRAQWVERFDPREPSSHRNRHVAQPTLVADQRQAP